MEHSSREPIANLEKIAIPDLHPNQVSLGKYLLLRTIQQTIKTNCLSTIVEDDAGNLSKISIYNCCNSDKAIDVENILPLGSTFILKEPSLTADESAAEKDVFTIRCGSPTNLILIGRHHKFYSLVSNIQWVTTLENEENSGTAEDLKSLGNDLYKKKKFLKAIELYSLALDYPENLDSSLRLALYLNLAASYLNLGYFEKTIECAQEALKLDPANKKAYFRLGRAYYELHQFSEAKQNFDAVILEDPENVESIKEQAKCNERLTESAGKVDIYKLYLSSTCKAKTTIDCAEYTGPLKIVEIPGKGRGVVANQNIKPGTLLSVSKAIGISFTECPANVENEVDGSQHGDNSKLVTSISLSIMKNPNTFGKLVYDFTSNDSDLDKDNKIFCDENTREEPIVDIDRIKKILNTNCYGINAVDVQERMIRFGVSKHSVDDGSGLFKIPSYMNHSCVFNASWQTYNDIMVTFAVKPIAEEDEVYLSYFNNLNPFPLREKTCSKRQFQCSCLLCELDRKEPSRYRKERKHLQQEIDSLTANIAMNPGCDSKCVLVEMRQFLKNLEATYDDCNRSELRTSLLVPYMKVALAFLRTGQIPDMLESLNLALNTVGLDYKMLLSCSFSFPRDSLMTPMLFHIVVLFVCAYDYISNTPWAQKWLKVLIGLEKMYMGGNVQMVKTKFKIVPEHLFIKHNPSN